MTERLSKVLTIVLVVLVFIALFILLVFSIDNKIFYNIRSSFAFCVNLCVLCAIAGYCLNEKEEIERTRRKIEILENYKKFCERRTYGKIK